MEKLPRLFFDASVLIAAAASPDGGSALMLELCSRGKAEALVSRLILRQVERNIKGKLSKETLLRYYRLLGYLHPQLVPLPSPKTIELVGEFLTAKDAYVLGGAREGQATHLVTLDRKHLLPKEIRQVALPIIICTPGEYLQEWIESLALLRVFSGRDLSRSG